MNTKLCIGMLQTVTDADAFKGKLHNIIQGVYETKDNALEVMRHFLSEEQFNSLSLDLSESKVGLYEKDQFVEYLSSIITAIDEVSIVSFVFAVLPSMEIIDKIVKEINEQVKVLLDYSVDPTIYGGVVILKDGLVHDYSIRNKVDGYFNPQE